MDDSGHDQETVGGDAGEQWVELRDALGKLQGKYDPRQGVLEIQAHGVKTVYVLGMPRLQVGEGIRVEDVHLHLL